jgi:hypothetical protein
MKEKLAMLDIMKLNGPSSGDPPLNLVPNPQLVQQYFILRIRMELNDAGILEPISCKALQPTKPFSTDQDIPVIEQGDLAVDRLRKAVMATRKHPALVQMFEQGFSVVAEDPLFVTAMTVTVKLWVTNADWLNTIKPALGTVKNQRHFIRYCLMQMPENPINAAAFGYIQATVLVGDRTNSAYHVTMNGQMQSSTLLNDFIIDQNLVTDDPAIKQDIQVPLRTWTQEAFDQRTVAPDMPPEPATVAKVKSQEKSGSKHQPTVIKKKLPLKDKTAKQSVLLDLPKKKKKKKLLKPSAGGKKSSSSAAGSTKRLTKRG